MLTFLINKITDRSKGNKRTSVGILAGILGLISNLALFLAKFFIGSLSGSVSIMADAMNNLSDTASSFITLAGFKIAGKPADEDHPYGHERFEYISGFVISILVTYVGFRFLDSSFVKILHPSSVLLSPIHRFGFIDPHEVLAVFYVSQIKSRNKFRYPKSYCSR